MLVTHGDFFDGVVQHARWLALLGDVLYTFTLKLNQHFNAMRARLGLPYWSLVAVPEAQGQERRQVHRARSRKRSRARRAHAAWTAWSADTSIKAEIRDIGGILYCNDGDWVESLTALVETHDGTLRILHWHDVLAATRFEASPRLPAAPLTAGT